MKNLRAPLWLNKRRCRQYHCFCIALFLVFLTAQLSAQSNPDIFIRTFTTHDSILLRWVPADAETWRAGSQYGYLVERFDADAFLDLAGQDPTGKGSLLTASPILPLPKNDTLWNRLMQRDPRNVFVYDALFSAKKSSATEEKTQFGFTLKACDLSVETARAHGLFFCDRNIQPGRLYVYRIRLAVVPAGMKHTPAIAATDASPSALSSPAAPAADFRNRKVTLSFDAASTRTAYAGYIIERSEDSLHFTRINTTLLVFAVSQYEQDKTQLVYRDSFPANNRTYWYRIRGYSYFGIEGPPSPAVKGQGKDDWLLYPVLDTLFSPDNKQAVMRWHLSDSTAPASLKQVSVLRAPNANGPYQPVFSGPGNATAFTDEQPAFTNYYLVCVISSSNDTGYSYPHLLQLSDNEPPPVPQLLRGSIDTNGVVRLSWENVPASDLKGYRVFRCNSLQEEFYEVSDSILPFNSFTDTITLQTLTRNIFYCVRSVDRMYNQSAYSGPCRLQRPDRVAPVPPVIRFAVHTDSTICLGWINSSSDDVQCVELRRNDGVTLGCWTGSDTVTHFTDAVVIPGKQYSYLLVVTDSSGNPASAHFPVVQFSPRIYPQLDAFSATPDLAKRVVLLSWNAPAQAADRYIIYKAKKGEPLRTWKTVDGQAHQLTDRELYPGNTYVYKIKAVLKNGAETRPAEILVEF